MYFIHEDTFYTRIMHCIMYSANFITVALSIRNYDFKQQYGFDKLFMLYDYFIHNFHVIKLDLSSNHRL
jgi:hypothetical protein